jgi:hypothetical protein
MHPVQSMSSGLNPTLSPSVHRLAISFFRSRSFARVAVNASHLAQSNPQYAMISDIALSILRAVLTPPMMLARVVNLLQAHDG